MMTHEQKTRLGIFLSVATVVFIAVVGFFIAPKLRDPGDVYLIKFRDTSVHGLVIGSPVKYRGVESGRVTSIDVSRTDLDCVDVHVKIKPDLVVKTDMTATLVYIGLTGQKYIELSGGTLEAPNLKAHGEIPTGRGLGDKADDSWPRRTSRGSPLSSRTPRRAPPPSPRSSSPGGRPSRTPWPAWRGRPPSSPARPSGSCP
jgi:phospholipid/cholesterol/gamma-HCH transport system substrate-binding protein